MSSARLWLHRQAKIRVKCWVVPQGSHRFKKLQLLNRILCRISCWPSASRCSNLEAQQTSANACRWLFHRQKLMILVCLLCLPRLPFGCTLTAPCLPLVYLISALSVVVTTSAALLCFLACWLSSPFRRSFVGPSVCVFAGFAYGNFVSRLSQKSLGPPLDSYVIGIPWCNTRESACLQPFRSIQSIAIAEYDQCTWEHGMNSHTVDWKNPIWYDTNSQQTKISRESLQRFYSGRLWLIIGLSLASVDKEAAFTAGICGELLSLLIWHCMIV